MTRYVIHRLLQALPLLGLLSVLLFLLTRALGDPLATFGGRQVIRSDDRRRLIQQLGLDQPVINCVDPQLHWRWRACWHSPLRTQYVIWLIGDISGAADTVAGRLPYGQRRGLLRGDLGTSFVTRRPVRDMILERLPNTLLLMGVSEGVILLVALSIGITTALKPYSAYDHTVTAGVFIGYALPIQCLAFGLMYVFAVCFRRWGLPYLPTVGVYDPVLGRSVPQVLWHLVLPVVTLSTTYIAAYSRYIRAGMLDVLGQDYIRTARAKGLKETAVVLRHAGKNAALSLVTLVGLDLPFLLTGAVVTETIFAWPGVGHLFIEHTNKADIPVLMGILVMLAIAVVLCQLVTDLAYAYLDPRIRYA